MKRSSVMLSMVLAMAATAARATPVNLVQNGSFEQGSGSAGSAGSFTGWTVGGSTFGSGPGNGPQRIGYGDNATGYGDNVSPDPFTNSPDASGSNGAFFVDDFASESLSQIVALTAGTTYEAGFDFFQTNSGAANSGAFSLSASLDGTLLTTLTSDSDYGAGTWYHVSKIFYAQASSDAGFTFGYLSGGPTAKDVIVDNVYVEAAPASVVPEPATLALLATGLLGLGLLRHAARPEYRGSHPA